MSRDHLKQLILEAVRLSEGDLVDLDLHKAQKIVSDFEEKGTLPPFKAGAEFQELYDTLRRGKGWEAMKPTLQVMFGRWLVKGTEEGVEDFSTAEAAAKADKAEIDARKEKDARQFRSFALNTMYSGADMLEAATFFMSDMKSNRADEYPQRTWQMALDHVIENVGDMILMAMKYKNEYSAAIKRYRGTPSVDANDGVRAMASAAYDMQMMADQLVRFAESEGLAV